MLAVASGGGGVERIKLGPILYVYMFVLSLRPPLVIIVGRCCFRLDGGPSGAVVIIIRPNLAESEPERE